MGRTPGEFEQLVLLALVRLDEQDAYGARIKQEIEERSGREVYVGAVYTALSRLEKGGYVTSWVGEPTPQRGGRRKKHYRLDPEGEELLARAYRAYRGMTEDIAEELDELTLRRES